MPAFSADWANGASTHKRHLIPAPINRPSNRMKAFLTLLADPMSSTIVRLLMAKPILDDQLWSLLEPVISKRRHRFRYHGRKPIPDRAALTGILFVLKTGIGWEYLPQEIGCGNGMKATAIKCSLF